MDRPQDCGSPGCRVERASEAVERYLKALFELATRDRPATVGSVAVELGVAAPSASAMVKRLIADDLARRTAEGRVELTDRGMCHALDTVRRHRLLETFLVEALDLPWEDVHVEAARLEHAVSDRLLERIDAFLGHPSTDPHGDPIPPRHGRHDEAWATALTDAPAGRDFQVSRVRDRDDAALRHLGELGIRPGSVLQIVERAPFDGPLWVRVDGRRVALGEQLAAAVFGEPA